MSITKKPLIGLIVILALILASVPLQNRLDEAYGKYDFIEQSSYLSSSMLDKMSLGYSEITADIYWLRALQYFGGKNMDEQNPKVLYNYFDIITDLDPRFVNAYRFGGAFLAEPPPYGLGEFELGISVFEKGRQNNPENFRLPLEEAFLYYIYPKNYTKAAELFEDAGSKIGVSGVRKASIDGMAAAAHAQGGDRESSKIIWQEMYETSPSEGRRNFALRNLKEISTMEIEDELTLALAVYEKRYDKLPDTTTELVTSGIIKRIPASPLEGYYIIAPDIKAVKDTALAERNLDQSLRFLNAKSRRFNKAFGEYPKNLNELRDYIVTYTTETYPTHPLGEKYFYDPESGKVTAREIAKFESN